MVRSPFGHPSGAPPSLARALHRRNAGLDRPRAGQPVGPAGRDAGGAAAAPVVQTVPPARPSRVCPRQRGRPLRGAHMTTRGRGGARWGILTAARSAHPSMRPRPTWRHGRARCCSNCGPVGSRGRRSGPRGTGARSVCSPTCWPSGSRPTRSAPRRPTARRPSTPRRPGLDRRPAGRDPRVLRGRGRTGPCTWPSPSPASRWWVPSPCRGSISSSTPDARHRCPAARRSPGWW